LLIANYCELLICAHLRKSAAKGYSLSVMTAYLDWTRQVCLALPHTTEDVQWEHNLLFRVSGKIYCIANLEPGLSPGRIAFKCTPEKFAELVEIEGIVPAPYMARNHWVSITDTNALRQAEIRDLIQHSYRLVLERLPKKTQARLSDSSLPARTSVRPKRAAKRRK
jgi:predicted DNA-binding protein (MmcQ/YjbR family)